MKMKKFNDYDILLYFLYLLYIVIIFSLLIIQMDSELDQLELDNYELNYKKDTENFINGILYSDSIVPHSNSNGNIRPATGPLSDPFEDYLDKYPELRGSPMENMPLGRKGVNFIDLSFVNQFFNNYYSFDYISAYNVVDKHLLLVELISKPFTSVEMLKIFLSEEEIKALITISKFDHFWPFLNYHLGIEILLKYDPLLENEDFSAYIDYLGSQATNSSDHLYLYMVQHNIPIR